MNRVNDPDRSNRIAVLRGELRAKLPLLMALRVARDIDSGQFDSALASRAVVATSKSMAKLQADPNVAIAAGRSDGDSTGVGTRLRLAMDRSSASNPWPSSANLIKAWESTGAGVDLVVGGDGKFASVEVVASGKEGETLPPNWRFEALALGPDEMPDPHRTIGNPKMEGMPIPLLSSGTFRLNQPIRIALHVSDAGQTALGCLVFTAASE